MLFKKTTSPAVKTQATALIYHLMLVILLVFLISYPNIYYPIGSLIDREIIAQSGFLLLGFYYLYRYQTSAITITISATKLWLGALFVLCGLSIFWADNIDFFLSKYLLYLAAAVVFWLTLKLQNTAATKKTIARTLVFIATYFAIIGLIQALTSFELFAQIKPPAANFVNRNMVMQVIVLIFPLAIYLLFTDQHRLLSKAYPYITVLISAFVFHTHSRAAWLSILVELLIFAVAFSVYFAKYNASAKVILARQTAKALHFVLALLLLLLLINLSKQGWLPFWDVLIDQIIRFSDSVNSYNKVGGIAPRYQIWQDALLMFSNAPFFGSGLGSFFDNLLTNHSSYTADTVVWVHNDIIELMIEIGIAGLLLFLGFVVSLSLNIKTLLKINSGHWLFYLAISVAIVGSAVNMNISFPYQMIAPLVIFALYVGLIVNKSDEYNTQKRQYHLTFTGQILVLATAISVIIFVIYVNITWFVASQTIIQNISQNIKKSEWINPINSPFVCHKMIVRGLEYLAIEYIRSGQYNNSINALESFNNCVPNTWVYYNLKGLNLLKLKHYQRSVEVYEKIKSNHPKGFYSQHINQYLGYQALGNKVLAYEVYQTLMTEPQSILITRPSLLRNLIIMAYQQKQPLQFEQFYQLYQKYYTPVDWFAKEWQIMRQSFDKKLSIDVKPSMPPKR